MTPEQLRSWLLLAVGVAALIYALIPPIKAPYLTVAGSLLGLDPVIKAAK